jgi:hypothetical protein
MRRRRFGRFGLAADATGAGTDAAVSGIASPRSRMTSSKRLCN